MATLVYVRITRVHSHRGCQHCSHCHDHTHRCVRAGRGSWPWMCRNCKPHDRPNPTHVDTHCGCGCIMVVMGWLYVSGTCACTSDEGGSVGGSAYGVTTSNVCMGGVATAEPRWCSSHTSWAYVIGSAGYRSRNADRFVERNRWLGGGHTTHRRVRRILDTTHMNGDECPSPSQPRSHVWAEIKAQPCYTFCQTLARQQTCYPVNHRA